MNPFSETQKQNRAVRSMILNGGVGSAFDVVIHTKDMQHLHLDRYNNIKTRHSIYCVLFLIRLM